MVSLNEYLIHNAVTQAKKAYRNDPKPVTHQIVVNYLQGAKLYDALEEYLNMNVRRIVDLDQPLNYEREAL